MAVYNSFVVATIFQFIFTVLATFQFPLGERIIEFPEGAVDLNWPAVILRPVCS
jgi:hypothetical protein